MKNLLLATSLAMLCSTAAAADSLIGYDKFSFKAKHRAERVAGSLWYPAGRKTYRGLIGDNMVFRGTPAFVGASIAEGKRPLIVLSHGSGGNMDTLGWLSSAMVAEGALVLAVNHPGSATGDSSPRRSIRIWERPADLSAALDHVLADNQFEPFIDRDRIYSVGFSLGGLTALQLVGLTPDKASFQDYCNEMGSLAQDCLFFSKGGVDLQALPAEKFNRSMKDPRIAGSAAIDPAMSYAFTTESIQAASQPIQLINLGTGNDRWPAVDVGPNGSNLVQRLSNSDYVEIAPAHHFTFLAACKDGAEKLLIEEGEDPICNDPAGTDREAVHREVAKAISRFFGL